MINSVFANFVCAEFLIDGGDCSKDVRNGGWSVGRRGNRGETLCKIQQFFQQNTQNTLFSKQNTQNEKMKKTLQQKHAKKIEKKGEQRGDAVQNTTIFFNKTYKIHFFQTKHTK